MKDWLYKLGSISIKEALYYSLILLIFAVLLSIVGNIPVTKGFILALFDGNEKIAGKVFIVVYVFITVLLGALLSSVVIHFLYQRVMFLREKSGGDVFNFIGDNISAQTFDLVVAIVFLVFLLSGLVMLYDIFAR